MWSCRTTITTHEADVCESQRELKKTESEREREKASRGHGRNTTQADATN